MRASTFFKSSTIALIIFAAIFVLSLYWIANTLTTSRQLADEYQLLKNLVTVDLNRTVSKYLQTGDSTLLVTADEHLALISTIATTLKQNEFSQQLATDTQQLQNLLKTKFRALGKLSGNPLALLHNSEKNISALNHQLAKYAEQSTKLTPSDKLLFIITTEKVAASLSQLINAREHAFSTKENVISSALKQPLTELKNHSASLSSFPLLGIMEQIEQDSDDLSAYDEEPADLAQDALNELLAFIKNYQHEFQQTIELNNDRLDGSLLLARNVDNLEQLIMQGEQNIKTSQVAINEQLKLLVVLLVAFLFIYLMTTHYLQHIIILKPVRLLRDSFVQLVKTGEVHDITGISEKTELGEIAVSFNQMVANLRQQDKQKAKQLNLVSTALNTMQQQAHDIHQSSTDTSQHVHDVRDIMQDLGEATDTVNHLSQQVAINAETTQHAMVDSQNKVLQVINASASTDKAIQSGKIAIDELGQSVASVSSMLDVISNIADQTNLLALNAAIEAARAGQHGRGFSVVATEVRELASKTQDSLKRVGANLSQLQQASKTIEKSIFDIEKTSTEQHRIAGLLKDNADHVTQQALTSANVAKETLHQITRQRAHYLAFEQAMTTVNQQVIQSRDLAQNISHDVNAQVKDISITLQLVS